MSTAPELEAALTNEVTLKKISVALNALFGIPKTTYNVVKYREQEKPNRDTLLVELVLDGQEHMHLTIYISGPKSKGQYTWGFNQGDHAMTIRQQRVKKTKQEDTARLLRRTETEDNSSDDYDTHTYYTVRGYLKPEK